MLYRAHKGAPAPSRHDPPCPSSVCDPLTTQKQHSDLQGSGRSTGVRKTPRKRFRGAGKTKTRPEQTGQVEGERTAGAAPRQLARLRRGAWCTEAPPRPFCIPLAFHPEIQTLDREPRTQLFLNTLTALQKSPTARRQTSPVAGYLLSPLHRPGFVWLFLDPTSHLTKGLHLPPPTPCAVPQAPKDDLHKQPPSPSQAPGTHVHARPAWSSSRHSTVPSPCWGAVSILSGPVCPDSTPLRAITFPVGLLWAQREPEKLISYFK